MNFLLTVFSGPWAWAARVAVYAALVASIFAYGWVKGNEHGTVKLTNYQAAQVIAADKIIVKQGAATERVITQYVKVQGKTERVTQTVQQEVTKYVESNPSLTLDANWRLLFNASATNTLPDASGKPDDSLGAPTAAEALQVSTENNARANRTADRLDGLQNWIREQGKVK